MQCKIDYIEIENRYHGKGDSSDKQFCINAGINYKSYSVQRYGKGRHGMSLTTALLIAEYLNCYIQDFASINWTM